MRSMMQLVSGVAVAGVVAAGSTAFTGAGLTITTPAAHIGGTIAQTVTGTNVAAVTYTPGAAAYGGVIAIDIDFTAPLPQAPVAKTATVVPSGGAYTGDATQWACVTDGDFAGATCLLKTVTPTTVTTTGSYTGMTTLTISVT